MKTVQVIPATVKRMADGTTASPFSAGAGEIVETGRYTWRVTDHRGGVTQGLGRVPAATVEEAERVAARLVALGYAQLETVEVNP